MGIIESIDQCAFLFDIPMQSKQNDGRFLLNSLAVLLCTVLFGLLGAWSNPAEAQVVRTFTPRFPSSGQLNEQGDIVIIGNTLMTCPASDKNCAGVQQGTKVGQNNDFSMVYTDVDTDSTAPNNSSSATLNLPVAGSNILFAGLYWGAQSSAAARDKISFAVPGTTGYSVITANQVDSTSNNYQAFANVTAQVKAAGNGVYTAAKVQAALSGQYAGWSLVVVYKDPAQALRNLVVYDGYASVSSAPVNITVSGFLTPSAASGPVVSRIGVVAYEGDVAYTGDNFQLNGNNLSDALSPVNDFFNSSITRLGSRVATKNPDYVNQLGIDIDVLDTTGKLANSSTSATINLVTVGDTYFPGVVTFETNIFQPVLDGNVTKTVTDLNGGTVNPGDVLEYTIQNTNTGNDPGINTVLTDSIPANTTYVPGSLQVTAGANLGAKTDTSGPLDDQAEFDSGTNQVVFRLGTGATATTGGILNPNETTTIKFQVKIVGTTAGGTLISNQAKIATVGKTLGTTFTVLSDGDLSLSGPQPTTVTVNVIGSHLRLVKRITAINRSSVNILPTAYVDVTTGTGSTDDNAANWPSLPALVTATLDPGPGTNANFSPLLRGTTTSANVQPLDEVEYTIYFLSDGGRNAATVKLCDFIPGNSTYVPGTIQLAQDTGTGSLTLMNLTDSAVDADAGKFIANPGPFDPACNSTNNVQGAAFVNVGTVVPSTGAGTPTTSYGYIRFRAKVK
jgi:uncharacterized repeat protein (TIGR01451 family)